jgi:hypothetical protein
MSESSQARTLIGWQRAYVLAAAKYVREQALKSPDDDHARSVYAALLEVLDPARRIRRQHREQGGTAGRGSMWERRSGGERRGADRRKSEAAARVATDRRTRDRRGARDRRQRAG